VTTLPIQPLLAEEALPHWEGTRDGRLVVQRCPDTGRLIWPPRPMSPFGSRRKPEWVGVSGRGRIWSFVVPHPPLLPGFTEVAPYNVILVELDEDPTIRVVGNLLAHEGAALDSVDPSTIEIGAPVRAVFGDEFGAGYRLVRWVAD
jgi:uncharacterized OB-fold protein